MPHIIIEHSANAFGLKQNQIVIDAAFQAVLDSELFNPDNLKVRLWPVADFRLGLGDAEFVHVQCRIHVGRGEEQRVLLTEKILAALSQFVRHNTVLTAEVVEMDRASYSKLIVHKNTGKN